MYGYIEKAKEYFKSSVERQFWVEADILAAEAIAKNKDMKDDMIEILKKIAELPRIAESSRAIIFYNITHIYRTLEGKEDKVEKYI